MDENTVEMANIITFNHRCHTHLSMAYIYPYAQYTTVKCRPMIKSSFGNKNENENKNESNSSTYMTVKHTRI